MYHEVYLYKLFLIVMNKVHSYWIFMYNSEFNRVKFLLTDIGNVSFIYKAAVKTLPS